jgi:hypothetical protein
MELRGRMRGLRPFLILLVYALGAAAVALASLAVQLRTQPWRLAPGPTGQPPVGVGREVLAWLSFAQAGLLCLLVPAGAAAGIALEREKKTFEMLRATLLSAEDIVTGKLVAASAFGVVVLISSLPVAAWCSFFGGLAPRDLLMVYGFLLVETVWLAALGVAISAGTRRSGSAVVAAYGVVLVIFLGYPVLTGAAGAALSGLRVFRASETVAVAVGLVGATAAWVVTALGVRRLLERAPGSAGSVRARILSHLSGGVVAAAIVAWSAGVLAAWPLAPLEEILRLLWLPGALSAVFAERAWYQGIPGSVQWTIVCGAYVAFTVWLWRTAVWVLVRRRA